MKIKQYISYSIIVCTLFIVSSCTTTRVNENQYLLIKNDIKIENPAKEVSASDLSGLLQQRPNKKLFGVLPFGLWINSIFKKGGQSPQILESALIKESESQISKFLNNSGFYNSTVQSEIIAKGKKKKRVNYNIVLSEPYRIRNFNLVTNDDSLRTLVHLKKENKQLTQGSIFNVFSLDNEREELSNYLKDNGYFMFTKDYIFFEADSALSSREVDLTLKIRDFNYVANFTDDSSNNINHPVFYIKSISIKPDYIPFSVDSSKTDTLFVEEYYKKRKKTEIYKFIYAPPLKIKPSVISRSVFMENDRKYHNTDAKQTYQKLNELRISKYADINFSPSGYKSTIDSTRRYLDCSINLIRNPVHSYSIETEGTNSGGDLGIGGYLVYQNKNLFRGGEVFNIKLKGALEAQNKSQTTTSYENKYWLFNTMEVGIEANLYFPKFLAPINEEVFSRYFRPKTVVGVGYNVQDRIEYDRIISNITFGYEWANTKFTNHILYPLDINVVKVQTTPEFDSVLAEQSERFRTQYTDHLILGLKYSFIKSSQEINKIKDFYYLRANFESAGNLLNLFVNATGQEQNQDGYETVFGIRYSQFAKADVDFRYYFVLDKNHSVAMRSFVGLAFPYGNSIDIPFEKGYFGGGANGMRAWPLRYLGPGAYANSQNIERVGDIIIEGNFEYRFPIYKIFTGALFYDIGNIWLLEENETFPGGKFYFDNFISQLAMDVGLGIRLDFNYFIFRVDVAQKLRDPARPVTDRWVIGSGGDWFEAVWNLGIGYPF